MAYSLQFALPGTPTLFYGEEIGMGENLAVDDRLAVRTPMQWTAGPQAGFSTGARRRPVPAGADRSGLRAGRRQRRAAADRPGVAAQLVRAADPAAQGAAEIGWGTCTVVDVGVPSVLADASTTGAAAAS